MGCFEMMREQNTQLYYSAHKTKWFPDQSVQEWLNSNKTTRSKAIPNKTIEPSAQI